MRPVFAALSLLVAKATAQSVIDFTKLPSCAPSCAVLKQADTGCVPPAAPVTNQAIYQSCVCQSALLVSLHSSGALCQSPNSQCSVDDANKISQYYISLCSGPVVQPAGSSTSAAATTTTTVTASGSATATGLVKGVSDANQPEYNWWDGHWKWVVMVVVIFLAILFFWIGGVCLRRRIHRKREIEKANMAAKDAYVPKGPVTPGSNNRSVLSKEVSPPPPMTMSGGRNGMHMDGGVGGIAPPRAPPPRVRSRTNTLQSLSRANGSKTKLPEPVVWGPHQHQAAYTNGNSSYSPGNSVPPSPTVPSPTITAPPNGVFRNREAMNSEPRFVHYRATPNSVSIHPTNYSPQAGATSPTNYSYPAHGEDIIRPHTSNDARSHTPGGTAKTSRRHVLNSVKSDPALDAQVQPQQAELVNFTPNSHRKLTKRMD